PKISRGFQGKTRNIRLPGQQNVLTKLFNVQRQAADGHALDIEIGAVGTAASGIVPSRGIEVGVCVVEFVRYPNNRPRVRKGPILRKGISRITQRREDEMISVCSGYSDVNLRPVRGGIQIIDVGA